MKTSARPGLVLGTLAGVLAAINLATWSLVIACAGLLVACVALAAVFSQAKQIAELAQNQTQTLAQVAENVGGPKTSGG